MRRRRWPAGLAALVCSILIIAMGIPASASDPQLTVTGSSFAGVAISQWQGQFNELDGGDINFTVSSSVIGMNEFCANTVSFGATDIAFSTQQSNCNTDQVPYPFQYMPDVAGGLAFEYNLTGQNGQQITNLILNASILEGIFTGGISKWNDSAIQALNPAVPLPNEAITPFYRGDPSGENYLLSDYFLHTDPGPITAFQRTATIPTAVGQPSATWASFQNGVPPGLGALVPAASSDAASQGPAHTSGGISYVETAYAKNVGLPVASLVNQAGYAVQPTSFNVATALTSAILYSDLTQNLGNVYTNPNPDAYPISAYSYFVAQCVPSQAAAQNFLCDSQGNVTMGTAQGAELAQFITFVACAGQVKMATLGYSPLPPNLVEDDFQAAGRLPGGTTPAAPTAANCANPYITGALQPVGEPQQVATTNPGSDLSTGTVPAAAAAAAATAAAAAAAAGAKGAAGGHGAGAGSTSSGGTTSSGAAGSSSSAAHLAPGVEKVGGAQTHSLAVGAYNRVNLMDAAATRALGGWSTGEVALWCAVFVIAIVGLPLSAWYWQRRRRGEGIATTELPSDGEQ
jgi:phosphate transport system substrate-binding protein